VTREEALQALGLELSVSPAEIENALLEKVTQLEKRLTTAPTEALKDKYRRQLAEIEEARTVLLSGASVGGLSQTKLADLPLAQAAYTRGTGTGPRSNTGIALSPGQTLADRYELHEQIGAGGMGAVFSAYDRNRDKDIAIKVLLPQMLSSPKARERFLREARLASEMSHPNIATVFDVQQDGVYCFLTMELLHGQSLRTYLNNLKGLRKDMAVDDALRIVSQVCEALAYAHEKTVHRDIKPENIWLTEDGKAKVMDFGIALLTNSTQVLETMMSAGTPYYMAPEQLAGLSSVDGRVDQYAIAVMLYEMLSGQVPTGRIESLKKVRKDVPAAVSNAVDKALSQKPADRYGSIKEFQTALSKSGISAHAKNVKLIGSVISGLALVGILVGTFPSWKGLLPDRAAEASAKQEAARLEGEAKSLMKLVEAQSREIKDAVSKNSRDVERLQSQLRSARSTSERQELESSLHTAQRLAELTDELNSRVKSRMEGSNGLPTIDGKMNAAQLLLKNGNANAAIAAFTEIVDSVKALQSFPAEERNKLLAAQLKSEQQRLAAQPSPKPKTANAEASGNKQTDNKILLDSAASKESSKALLEYLSLYPNSAYIKSIKSEIDRLKRAESFRFANLPFGDAIKIVKGNGMRTMATFEDPNCGYCKRLAKELDKLNDVTIYVFIYTILSEDSVKKARSIWCSEDKARAWIEWMRDGKMPQSNGSCDTSALTRNQEYGRKYDIRGTPTLFYKPNRRVPGTQSLQEIESLIGNH